MTATTAEQWETVAAELADIVESVMADETTEISLDNSMALLAHVDTIREMCEEA